MEKIYIGKGKKAKYDSVMMNICLTDIPKDLIFAAKTGKKYLSVILSPLKIADKYGNEYCVYILKKEEEKGAENDQIADDLPF